MIHDIDGNFPHLALPAPETLYNERFAFENATFSSILWLIRIRTLQLLTAQAEPRIASLPLVESYILLGISFIIWHFLLILIGCRGAGMGNSHQFRVSEVHESDGKFLAFYKILQVFVYFKYTVPCISNTRSI